MADMTRKEIYRAALDAESKAKAKVAKAEFARFAEELVQEAIKENAIHETQYVPGFRQAMAPVIRVCRRWEAEAKAAEAERVRLQLLDVHSEEA